MRVSAVGWLYDSMERTREVARATANVTHNHPEGIKGCLLYTSYQLRSVLPLPFLSVPAAQPLLCKERG